MPLIVLRSSLLYQSCYLKTTWPSSQLLSIQPRKATFARRVSFFAGQFDDNRKMDAPPSYVASEGTGSTPFNSRRQRQDAAPSPPGDAGPSSARAARFTASAGSSASRLRVVCVQFDPKLMCVEENVRRVRKLTDRIPHGSVDLLVLPEMALTGYMFESRSEIEPYLEVAAGSKDDGPSLALYCELATRIGCWVLGGFAERQKPTGSADGAGSASTPQDSETAFNSALLVSPSGDVAGTYRKTFLYDTDKTWAKEGAGFGMWELPPPIGRLVVGICMDLNPRDFIAPWDAYEFAKFAQAQQADVIAMPMNWLAPDQPSTGEGSTDDDSDNDGPSMSTLNYWAHRLMPLHDPAPGYGARGDRDGPHRVTFVACNRTGVERGTRFAGSSAVLTMSADPSRVELVAALGRDEEGLLVAEVKK